MDGSAVVIIWGQVVTILIDKNTSIDVEERKSANIARFLGIVRKYTTITEPTPEIRYDLVERIVVHVPEQASGCRA